MAEINYQPLIQALKNSRALHDNPLARWAEQLPQQIAERINPDRWGDLPAWQQAMAELPDLSASEIDLQGAVRIGNKADCQPDERDRLQQNLMALHPWRKGPFDLFGLTIDTEWRSDWKWERIRPHLSPLQDKLVLDVGCGSGYHCWRMFGDGAKRVIGIDPSVKFVCQFYAIKHYVDLCRGSPAPVDVLPLGIEHLPSSLEAFDTVFSMGVLYHRKNPMQHIEELKACLKPGGQLVLETLVIEGDKAEVLVPEGRYAKMRNVWAIPTISKALDWLHQSGLKNPQMVDINRTTVEEQRATSWMTFESLADFLDPNDPCKTIEGYPAPIRAFFTAEK